MRELTIFNYSCLGREHGVGIFVSLVTRGSQADIVGLKVGNTWLIN